MTTEAETADGEGEASGEAERWIDFVARWRRAIVGASLTALALSALALGELRLDMDVVDQLPSRSQVFRDYRTFLESFGTGEHLVALVTGPPGRIPAFAEAFAADLDGVEDLESVRYRFDATSMLEQLTGPSGLELLDGAGMAELAERLRPDAIAGRVSSLPALLAAPMAVGGGPMIARDPLGIAEVVGRSIERRYGDPRFRPGGEYLSAADGRALLVLMQPRQAAFDTVFAERLLDRVRQAATRLLAGPFAGERIEVSFTGSVAYAVGDKTRIRSDLQTYFVVVPLLVLAVFHLGFRTLRVLPLVAFPLVVGTFVTFAIAALGFDRLNMISVAFAGIFYGLGIDASIYWYASLAEQPTASVRDALVVTLRKLGRPTVAAALTSAAVFFALGASEFTAVRQLGVLTAVAILLNVVGTLALLPALALIWVRPGAAPPRWERLERAYDRLASSIARRRRVVLGAVVVVVLAVLPRAATVGLDGDFRSLRPTDHPAVATEEAIAREFGRSDEELAVVVRCRVFDECLQRTEVVTAALESERRAGTVRSISSLSTFLPSSGVRSERSAMLAAMGGRGAAELLESALTDAGFALPPFARALAHLRGESAPTGPVGPGGPGGPGEPGKREADRFPDLRDHHVRQGADGVTMIATFVSLAGGAAEETPALARRLRSAAGDSELVIAAMGLARGALEEILRREGIGFFLAAALGNLALLVVLAPSGRRVREPLTVLVPTLVSLVLFLAVMATLGIAINPVSVIIVPIVIGLSVDHGLYLVAHGRDRDPSRRGVRALVLVTGTTLAGFGSLVLASHPALHALGVAAVLGLGLAVVVTLLLVPALDRESREPEPLVDH